MINAKALLCAAVIGFTPVAAVAQTSGTAANTGVAQGSVQTAAQSAVSVGSGTVAGPVAAGTIGTLTTTTIIGAVAIATVAAVSLDSSAPATTAD